MNFSRRIKFSVLFAFLAIGVSSVVLVPSVVGEDIPFTGGKYAIRQIEGKRDCWHDLEVEIQDHRKKITLPLGYECSSATCAAISPDGRNLYVSGVHGGSGKLWMAQYDLVRKKRAKNLDALIPADAVIPICIRWNDDLKRLELEDGSGKSFRLEGILR